jgi:hypothetical protein
MAKHRSPCKLEYDRRNPPMTVRLTRNLRGVLDQVKGDRPYSQAMKEMLTEKLKPAEELAKQLEQLKKDKKSGGAKDDVFAVYSRMFGRAGHTRANLAIFNQMRAEEAGRIGESNLDPNKFLTFLLNLYQAVKGDSPVLSVVWKKTGEKEV